MSQSTQKKKKKGLKHKNIWESKAGLKGSYIKTQKQKKKRFFFCVFWVYRLPEYWKKRKLLENYGYRFSEMGREKDRLNRIQTDRKGTNEN